MIERVHEHIINELGKNTWTDIIFVLTAILLNLLTLGINSGVAAGGEGGITTIVMLVFVFLLIMVNLVVEIGLIRGKRTRTKLLNGLLRMYKDQGVEGYYDPSLLSDYQIRYNLFMLAVLSTGLVALIIPFIIR
ncbi:MAG: hypothetical protein QGF23_02130 [Dehalococcoidales bacterium]|jgi:hypothetical protein|nr:hypothetical protein [Dehalococcoidales bacterium]